MRQLTLHILQMEDSTCLPPLGSACLEHTACMSRPQGLQTCSRGTPHTMFDLVSANASTVDDTVKRKRSGAIMELSIQGPKPQKKLANVEHQSVTLTGTWPIGQGTQASAAPWLMSPGDSIVTFQAKYEHMHPLMIGKHEVSCAKLVVAHKYCK